MNYAGKVFSSDIFIGNVSANSMTALKRRASALCNRYNRAVDTMILHRADGKEVDGLKFTRRNVLSPNNEVIRGKWQ